MSEKSDKIIKELGYSPAKSKKQQVQDTGKAHGRDLFQTPNYAVNLLLPFIPKEITDIWECAAGLGKISTFLSKAGYQVYPTDINPEYGFGGFNFLKDKLTWSHGVWAIVTNPPFSLKQKFYDECLKYKVPFALLIPADYSGWIIKACQDGAEKIVPTRRVDYITPNTLQRIHEGEAFELYCKDTGWTDKITEEIRLLLYEHYPNVGFYNRIDDVPVELLSKYSSSDFHSMWLTKGFNLGRTETFVELSLKEKKENI